MHLSVADRTIALNARELATFSTGPMAAGGAHFDPARAQLGVVWHEQLRQQLGAREPAARFELPVDVTLVREGWRIRVTGRIDQVVPGPDRSAVVREVKTVMRPLPISEDDLRAEFPDYFLQLAVYQCLFDGAGTWERPAMAGVADEAAEGPEERPQAGCLQGAKTAEPSPGFAGELVFVEPASGFVQAVAQSAADAWRRLDARLDELCAFAVLRRAGLERLRTLRYAPAFEVARPGQETILDDLRAAATRSPVVFFEAPTGYGKTGCVLEYALGELASGRLTRLLYLTGKSTGQLQVVRQLAAMVGDPPGATWWQVRNKAEHCINPVYHCFRDACTCLDGQEDRWAGSGLGRFAQDPSLPRDLDSLRTAGREALVCPYEITRATLPFTDIWVADYNYVFAPANRGFLGNLPGFEPAHTLLVIDEAHNLPSRVAGALSSELTVPALRATLAALVATGAASGLATAWERLTLFVARLERCDMLDPELEAELRERFAEVVHHLQKAAPDYSALGPGPSETLFQIAGLQGTSEAGVRTEPELIWAPARGVLRFTCLDAAGAIAETLRAYGHAVFLSATLSPIDVFARQCGLDRLGVEPHHLVAPAPWREGAYDVAIDARVDTRYDQRARHHATTAAAVAALHAAGTGPIVAFFPSYAYAEAIVGLIEAQHPEVRAVLQPRTRDLAEQAGWVDESIVFADVLVLVLGSSFSESIDLLGGRVAAAIVVGPALPEVNAVQRARLQASRAPNRGAAFREVYQVPGMQKVNQALGRLVRAPGQRARVVLHCRRFAEEDYLALLAPEYQDAAVIACDEDFAHWLQAGA